MITAEKLRDWSSRLEDISWMVNTSAMDDIIKEMESIADEKDKDKSEDLKDKK